MAIKGLKYLCGVLGLVAVGCGGDNSSSDKAKNASNAGSSNAGSGNSGTGGSTGTGGSAGSAGGTSKGGTMGMAPRPMVPDGPPPDPQVLPCDGLGGIGEWQEITPPGSADPGSFVVDPVNSGIVYMGSSAGGTGIYRSKDCGATWEHVNVGTVSPDGTPNSDLCGFEGKTCAETLNSGRQWTFGIDQVYPQIIYTNDGFGVSNGMMKSMNNGVDWLEIWPAKYDDESFDGVPGFVGDIVVDPYDHNHILIDFHDVCSYTGRHPDLCIAESPDGGASWNIVDGDPAMGSAHESKLGFLNNSDTWVFLAAGLWRTTNRGQTWTKVSDDSGGGQIYQADDGVFYLMTAYGITRSTDGINWTTLSNTGTLGQGLVGGGSKLFASSYGCAQQSADVQPFLTSPVSDGVSWTRYPTVSSIDVGALEMHYDAGHKLLFSSNCSAGFWRVRTE